MSASSSCRARHSAQPARCWSTLAMSRADRAPPTYAPRWSTVNRQSRSTAARRWAWRNCSRSPARARTASWAAPLADTPSMSAISRGSRPSTSVSHSTDRQRSGRLRNAVATSDASSAPIDGVAGRWRRRLELELLHLAGLELAGAADAVDGGVARRGQQIGPERGFRREAAGGQGGEDAGEGLGDRIRRVVRVAGDRIGRPARPRPQWRRYSSSNAPESPLAARRVSSPSDSASSVRSTRCLGIGVYRLMTTERGQEPV